MALEECRHYPPKRAGFHHDLTLQAVCRYAVRKGKTPGVYDSWDDCQYQVHQFSGAIFKSFSSREEAESYAFPTDDAKPSSGLDGAPHAVKVVRVMAVTCSAA
jgi:hypothetical protein